MNSGKMIRKRENDNKGVIAMKTVEEYHKYMSYEKWN